MNTQSVLERLSDTPEVARTIVAAAAGAHQLPGADPRAMSHAWLFSGPPGSGRSQAALGFAAALMCTSVATGEYGGEIGCGRCRSCRQVLEEHTHTDLVFYRPQELSISVDTVRDVVAKAATRPTVAKFRVIIFDNADRLTDGAANALLKTVEEPHAATVIIMCAPSADPEDFSQTLRSRCRHLYIPTPSRQAIVTQLVSEGASVEHAELAAQTSLRHFGRARHLVFSPAAQELRVQAISLAQAVFDGSAAFQASTALLRRIDKEAAAAMAQRNAQELSQLEKAYGAGAKGKGTAKLRRDLDAAVKELEAAQKKRGTRQVRNLVDLALVDLAGVYRDALVLASGATVNLTHPDFQQLSQHLATQVSAQGLVTAQDAIRTCREHIDANVAVAVAFDGLIGRLRLACDTSR